MTTDHTGTPLIDPQRITIVYTDHNGKQYEQPLADIVHAGTLIDPDTGEDLDIAGAHLTEKVAGPQPETSVSPQVLTTIRELASRENRSPDYDRALVDLATSLSGHPSILARHREEAEQAVLGRSVTPSPGNNLLDVDESLSEQTNNHWVVNWFIDSEAGNPVEAAIEVWQERFGRIGLPSAEECCVFVVTDIPTGRDIVIDLSDEEFAHYFARPAPVVPSSELISHSSLIDAVAQALDDREAHAAAQLVRDTDPDDDLWKNYLGPMLDALQKDYTEISDETNTPT